MKYLCLDMAINTAYPVLPLQKEFPVNQCLFKHTDDEFIWDAAPWLFALSQKDFYTVITDPLITFNHHLIIESNETIEFLCEHLKPFIYQQIDNKTYYYRFWDARVFAKEIPQYNEEKLNRFFNNYIQAIYIEDGSKDQLLKFSLNSRQLLSINKCSRLQLFAPVVTTNEPEEKEIPKTNYPNTQANQPAKKRRFWTG